MEKNPLPQGASSPKNELKTFPPGLKYAYLEKNETFFVIINNNLTREQEEKLLDVLRRNRKAIGWTLSDLVGIGPDLRMHHIRLEEGAKAHRDPQRKLNPNMREQVLKEVLELVSLGIIYSILGSEWVSPVHMVPKKSGIQVVNNEKNKLVPTRLVTGWRMCIDYKKLNTATRKDHFPLPFIDQMLERLPGKQYFCFLNGYSGYFHIYVNPEEQDKITFTCPFGTYAYRRMPFGLCNAPGTFQRCMMSMFSDLLEECIEIIMGDFTVYGDSFESCLGHLDVVLRRCQEKNLVLNFEKCHFMVPEGIVLGHVNDIDFVFDEACQGAFQLLKEKLVSAPIIRASDWNHPFEVMCDTSDFAVGAAQKYYDTTEKEMLAVVYSFEKFRPKGNCVRHKKDTENEVADHLSMILQGDNEEDIPDVFLEELLYYVVESPRPISWAAVLALTGPGDSDKGKYKLNT
ncbi:uncharacterized protein K02A2.6-like [Salvia splendens]|uniref:uncharacterized protein K02A2.6-like n=1 Tax=Salvia splendens TaxID=180675 RepID=UPI001C25916C|nr:uncharacterized protein K02A2.6-like [Salvia splendens]